MKKHLCLILLAIICSLKAQLPYLNASTGNLDEFPIDQDTNMYGFYNNTLFKANKDLSVLWSKTYTLINFSGLLLSKTHNLFFFGNNQFGKMDLDGNIIWAKSIDGIDAITTGTTSSMHTVVCNRVLLDRNNNLIISGTSNTSNGFILKTDTNGNFIKLKMLSVANSYPCQPSSYGFQVINDSSGIYKVVRFAGAGSMCSASQEIVCFNYNDNNELMNNYNSLATNPTEGYLMQWKIKKSKRNTDFYLHIDHRPSSSGMPTDVSVLKFNLSAINLWATSLKSLDGETITLGWNATENYKGQVLCQLANPNTSPRKIAVALIDTNGVTNGSCLVTHTTCVHCYWDNVRLQSMKNNTFLSENIKSNLPFNPFKVMKINSALTSTCALTKTCLYTTGQGSSAITTNSFSIINPINSYNINSISSTYTTLSFSISAAECTLNDVGLNEYNSEVQTIKLYPNPTSNILKFDLANSAIIEEVRVLNVNGKIIKTHSNCKEISVNDFLPGIYFLQLKSEGRLYYTKFIKE